MDLIYKIYSVYLYDNQLNHDYVFFYNRIHSGLYYKPGSKKRTDFTGQLSNSAPYHIGDALNSIYNLDKNDPEYSTQSIRLMENAVKQSSNSIIFKGLITELIKASDIITLIPIEEGRVSYSGVLSPGDHNQNIVTEGKYKGLKKQVYTPYNIMWNETKSGINPHEFEVMGVWNAGQSTYSTYRIYEEADQRAKTIRDNKLISIL